jgi:trypsin
MAKFLAIVLLGLVAASNGLPRILRVTPGGGRIVGGGPVDEGELPYQLSFQYSGSHICGASIISPSIAVTAGHCIIGTVRQHSVVAGEHSLRTVSGNEQSRTLTRIEVHPQYSGSIYVNDIAILFLSSPLEFNDFVQAIELPESMIDTTGDIIVSGWGALSSGGSSPDILQKVDVPIVTNERCSAAYQGINPVADSMLCAGVETGGRDSCQGDSGGPLAQDGVLVGIVSWGVGCAQAGYPGVNTRVSHFREFIDQFL